MGREHSPTITGRHLDATSTSPQAANYYVKETDTHYGYTAGIEFRQHAETGDIVPVLKEASRKFSSRRVPRRTVVKGLYATGALGVVGGAVALAAVFEPQLVDQTTALVKNDSTSDEDNTIPSDNRYIENSPDFQSALPEGEAVERDPLHPVVEAHGEFIISQLTTRILTSESGELADTIIEYLPRDPEGITTLIKEIDEDGNQKYDENGQPLKHPISLVVAHGKVTGDIHPFSYFEGGPLYDAITLLPLIVDKEGNARRSVKRNTTQDNITEGDTEDFEFNVHFHALYQSRTGEQTGKLVSQIHPDENADIGNLLDIVDAHFSPLLALDVIPHVFVTKEPTNAEVTFENDKTVAIPELGFVYHPLELLNTEWDLNSTYDVGKAFIEGVQGQYGQRHKTSRAAELDLYVVNNYLRHRGLELFPERSSSPGEAPVPPFMYVFMPNRYDSNFAKSVAPYNNFAAVPDQDRFAEWLTTVRHFGDELLSQDGVSGKIETELSGNKEYLQLAKLYFTACYNLFDSVANNIEAQTALIPHLKELREQLQLSQKEYQAILEELSQ